jgi:hypothetical protein
MKEGAKNLPWEKEAYNKQGKQSPIKQQNQKDVDKQKKRKDVEAFALRSNPNITRKQMDKAWKSIDRFEKLNKK